MSKPTVFVSHINQEAQIATQFKNLMEMSFLHMLHIFVSSDPESNPRGANWIDEITGALKTCQLGILICSPQSIKRPWINFEAGAFWVRGIPTIPVCHSGLLPSELPLPIALLNGVKAGDAKDMETLIPVFAKIVGGSSPKIDFGPFSQMVREFEEHNNFWIECNQAFYLLLEGFGKETQKAISTLKAGHPVKFMDFNADTFDKLQRSAQFLKQNRVLEIEAPLARGLTYHGTVVEVRFVPLERLNSVMVDHRFNP